LNAPTPKQGFPLTGKLFVAAVWIGAVIGPSVNMLRWGGWNGSAWLQYGLSLCILAATTWYIVKDISRQRRVALTEVGVVLEVWSLRSAWPLLHLREETIAWRDVLALQPAGLVLELATTRGKRTLNLFSFEKPREAAQFAFEQWTAHRPVDHAQ